MPRLTAGGQRLWTSPTLWTWASLLARLVGFGAILPIVLTRLEAPEIALWLFFGTVNALLLTVDMGFGATFSRVIAYGMAGVEDIHDVTDKSDRAGRGRPNWALVHRINGTMRGVYATVAGLWALALAVAATWFALPLIRSLDDPRAGTIAWSLVILFSTVRLHGIQYSTRLSGYNEIPSVRRAETVSFLLGTAGSVVAILAGWGLVGLVVASQGALALNSVWNRWQVRSFERAAAGQSGAASFDASIFRDVWPAVWRSGVGLAMTTGVTQATGIVYARFASAENAASYLMALAISRYIVQFSQAPFYSKLPLMARLHAENRIEEKERVAERGMRLGYWSLVLGFVAVGVLVEPAFAWLRPNARFVPHALWVLMALAAFVARYGAMHLQLYTTANRIIWHIANGVSGLLCIALLLVLYRRLGVYAFPLSQLASDLLFYSWYSAVHSYRIARFSFWWFERRTSLAPLTLLCLYSLAVLVS